MSYFVLVNDQVRARAANACTNEPDGYVVKIGPPGKSRSQENTYHDLIEDIAKSGKFSFLGRVDWDEEDVKRLLVDSFAQAKSDMGEPLAQAGRVVPSLDMQRTVQLGIQTRKFKKREASDFIEFLRAYGADLGVEFSV